MGLASLYLWPREQASVFYLSPFRREDAIACDPDAAKIFSGYSRPRARCRFHSMDDTYAYAEKKWLWRHAFACYFLDGIECVWANGRRTQQYVSLRLLGVNT